ncbi:MAG: SDR family NAD(P)-dependent oxidoreductase [Candidatus Saccharicenans sp.]|nr:SDR family NAD(P)-dependent oxidoreductase [Candidatus Saccharicenans sp.]
MKKFSEALDFRGKVAAVTGAASGIGLGVVQALAEAGATVMMVDVDVTRVRLERDRLKQAGFEVEFSRADVRSEKDCEEAVAETVKKFGKLDILVNSAGVIIRKDVLEMSEEEWDLVLDVNLKGVFLMCRAALPHLIETKGSIVNIGSGWSLKGGPKAAAYCASKAGVLNFTRALAIDCGKYGVRVNCVCPGDVDTPMLRKEALELGLDLEEFLREAAARPVQRPGIPDDVAGAVLFLASPLADWITGTSLVVDGGGLA